MTRKTTRMLTSLTLLVVVAPGCSQKLNDRILMLEDTNRALTNQLNAMRGELDQGYREREGLGNQLLAATSEADDLRGRLANQPEPMPMAAPGWKAVPGGAMIAIETGVLFASGKVKIRNEAKRTLDGIVSTLQGEYEGQEIFVVGHTDDRPIKKSGWKDNWQLSTERSLAVVRYLAEHGVTRDRLVACGAGEYRPIVDNDSPANRASNRRVEIFAMDPASSFGK